MRRTYAAVFLLFATVAAALTGCKKDNQSEGDVLASLTDSTGNIVMLVTYDSDHRVSRLATNDAVFDFYFSGGKLIKRTQAQSGSIAFTDSFFYDGNSRFARVDRYDENMAQVASTVFAYNGDNTVNTINFNSSVIGTPDKLFEFTYSGGTISMVKEQEKVLGNFIPRRQYEFLAFDGHENPAKTLIHEYVPDQVNLLTVLFWGNQNFTSAKQTDYTNNGNVSGIVTLSASYTYTGSGLPKDITTTINGSTNRTTFNYTKL